MNMYLWTSEALKDYYEGEIIACGETEDEARKAALGQFLATLGDEDFSPDIFYLYEAQMLLDWGFDDWDPYYMDKIITKYREFVSDITAPPKCVVPCTEGAFMLKGGS